MSATDKLGKLDALSDQTLVSVLEYNRVKSLDLDVTQQETNEITSALATLNSGLAEFDQQKSLDDLLLPEEHVLNQVHEKYQNLVNLFGQGPPEVAANKTSNPPKTVRFSDKLSTNTFPSYRDDPSLDRESSSSTFYSDTNNNNNNNNTSSSNSSSSSPPGEQLRGQDLLDHQQQVMAQQDLSLDALSDSIDRQRELSIQIGSELSQHSDLLDDVDGLVDTSHSRLRNAKRHLDVFSRKARDHSSMITIIVLIIILVLLIAILK